MNQSEPKVTSEECTCATLRRASRTVSQFYDVALAPTKLRATQFSMLKAIDEAGEIAQCQYAREYGIAVETLSRGFASLRRRGLLKMRLGEHGEHMYALTPKGHQVLLGAVPYWERAQERLRAGLGEGDWHSLAEVCDRVWRAAPKAEQLRTKNDFQDPPTRSGLASAAD